MDSKEFKQELIQELLLNIQPSYYKQIEILSLSVFLFIKQFLNTIINERRLE